jgi:phospholipid/cholesterol/gamma-HCH transport system substrate-binding protein
MSPRQRVYVRFFVVFTLLGGTGLAASAFLLVEERAPLPFQNVYKLRAEFNAADGVVSGLGQPVNVVGVTVGQVVGTQLVDGQAVVTFDIQRAQLPRVYQNATAVLEPITPLHDLQINLTPGGPPAAPIPAGGTIGIGQTTAPVPLSDLLSTLDGDTRTFLSSLIASLDQGTAGRGPDMRRMLEALGPTTAQAGQIMRAVAQRRAALARLVHNLAVVTSAASRDRQLASLVVAGNQTLQALAQEDRPLRKAIAKLPRTLAVAQRTLVDLEPFAQKLGPTVSALLPAVRRLPATFDALRPFADAGTNALQDEIRPLIRDAQPLVSELAPIVTTLSGTTPHLSRSFEVLTYLSNELAYNRGGANQGFLSWMAWAFHNLNSVISVGDAHGGILRAQVLANCSGVQQLSAPQKRLAILGLCPK